VIEGTVRVTGRVQVDGQIDGTLIAQGNVSVGPSGVISGEVVAHDLVVGGRVEGKVNVTELLHIAPNGIARGEVRYGSLCVDRGGVLDGSTAHGEDTNTLQVDADPASTPPLPTRAASAAG
jgi:cytoskeletal protein CcmA (bactofilin family)